MSSREFLFEWDQFKASANAHKHEVSFELARTIFNDPLLLTVADLGHGDAEDRWLSIGHASNSSVLSVAYLWLEAGFVTKIRIISARKSTKTERRHYEEQI